MYEKNEVTWKITKKTFGIWVAHLVLNNKKKTPCTIILKSNVENQKEWNYIKNYKTKSFGILWIVHLVQKQKTNSEYQPLEVLI